MLLFNPQNENLLHRKVSIAAKKEKIDPNTLTKMMKNFVGAASAALLTGSIGTFFMCGL